MNAEFDRQAKATEYRIPDDADKPNSNTNPPGNEKQRKKKKESNA